MHTQNTQRLVAREVASLAGEVDEGRDGRLVGDERVNGAAELVPGAHEYC